MITTQSNVEASQEYDKRNIDLFSRPPAGYSLTQEPNKWPWDKPPQYAKFEDAYENIKSRLLKSNVLYDLLNLLDAGISVETIVRSVTFAAFTKGMITPDVSELLLPPLSLVLTLEANKAGITPTVRNNTPNTGVSETDVLDIMKDLRPYKYYALKSEAMSNNEMPSVKQTEVDTNNKMADSFLTSINKEGK